MQKLQSSFHLITRTARANTFGGILFILDGSTWLTTGFRFTYAGPFLDSKFIG
jgi:hypothetical protein